MVKEKKYYANGNINMKVILFMEDLKDMENIFRKVVNII